MTRRPPHIARAAKQARPKTIHFVSGLEGDPVAHLHGDESDDTNGDSEDSDEGDIDGPRVAQWIDDEGVDLQDETSASLGSEGADDDDHSASEAGPSRRLQSLQDDLSTLPLGTLRSAQRSLAQAQALSDTESDSEEQSDHDISTSEDDDSFPLGMDKQKPNQSSKRKNVTTKRANKHAPVEVTSKRPVSRRRVVVDDALPKPRDPRFMHAAGRYDPSKFKQQYDFLSGLHSDELSMLRENMKRAQKRLASSPSHLRAEREGEVKRLEHAVKRAESAVNLDNRERVESKVLQSAKQAEKEKRKQGKTGWWMKRSEKRALLAKARLNAIASVGGKQAAKKAVEKKQKKISQKEKKMRPFPRSDGMQWSDGTRRRPVGPVDAGREEKRRKVV